MELVNILALLLIAPYVFAGNMFGIGDTATNAKTETKKEKCPSYSCLKSMGDQCKKDLKAQDPPIIVDDDLICTIFDKLTEAVSMTSEEEEEAMKEYGPFLCCLFKVFGIAKCIVGPKGEIKNITVAADPKELLTPKCDQQLEFGAEVFDITLLGKLKSALENVVPLCNSFECGKDIRLCFGGILSGINTVCEKKAQDTFCPGRKDTHAQ